MLADCTVVPVKDVHRQPYILATGFEGPSIVAGASGQTLVGLDLVNGPNGKATAVKRAQVVIDGTSASNGKSDTVVAADPTSPVAESALTVSCGTLTITGDGERPTTG